MSQETFQIIVAVAAGIVALSFIFQAIAFLNIYGTLKKISMIAESLQKKLEPVITRVEPVLVQVQTSLVSVTGAVDSISSQAKETFEKVTTETRAVAAAISVTSQRISNIALRDVEQVSGTLDQTTDMLQRHVSELDRIITRTEMRIEDTTTEVQTSILTPVRELSALIAGIRRTLEMLFKLRRTRTIEQPPYQDEEMFI